MSTTMSMLDDKPTEGGDRGDPVIVLQPPTRADTVPGVVRFDIDNYIKFDDAFASWYAVVPSDVRGPRDVLDDIAKVMGPFAYSPAADAERTLSFHPAMLEPLLRAIGARGTTTDDHHQQQNGSGSSGSSRSGAANPNDEAVRVANDRIDAVDARIADLISSRRTSVKRKSWNAMLANSTARLIDPDALCRALAVSYDGEFMRECYDAPRDLPDEPGATRTVPRDVALTVFEWARRRATVATRALFPRPAKPARSDALGGGRATGSSEQPEAVLQKCMRVIAERKNVTPKSLIRRGEGGHVEVDLDVALEVAHQCSPELAFDMRQVFKRYHRGECGGL